MKTDRITYAKTIEDGYLRLAESILKLQARSYEAALDNLAGHHSTSRDYQKDYRNVQRIEEELLSGYYSKLTMGAMDFKKYINDMREKHGITPREWGEET